MTNVSERVIVAAIKKVVRLESDGEWRLSLDLTGEPANDLRNFLQAHIESGERSVSGVEGFLSQQISQIVETRIAEKKQNLDDYEQYVVERSGRGCLEQVWPVAQELHRFIIPSAN
ncbi:hypothetical protein GCM10007870_08080 [Gluconobacter kondonii]|uniref:Uncharacterized protein n=1 Tax=Gluconobacter kondonii TaxID=941463 RepID=A0ABQ5WPJ8_9PROT|nr:hypothetical protein AA3266_1067 [Gluconobacter kondonii NBRC 3266]GLQ65224.1 hypothetical protein GCM10007870_08080 [Gluconobacter kondonii]